ncbi:rhodanese-like domain-containing protein [Rummeliibacillus stabekisii]|uniref:rhodanese-like domain-containing protein n=1 Tax=Rummeliibacillus stabekisii TaxID=241244 RepID=UPI0026813FB6
MNGVSLAELNERMKNGEVLLLDVRPIEEFESTHIKDVVCMPIEELRNKLSSIPQNCKVVAYCRGTYFLMSVKVVKFLKS